ncbi:MAG: hypothetical protein LAP40_23515 [Acidobacteriia bacterium]|nr:hypothetical protein [Terriglobia bacterium]
MNYERALGVLYGEREKLNRVIASLEELAGNPAAVQIPSRRGRKKGMSAQERREISDRMKKYWASRRATARKAAPAL